MKWVYLALAVLLFAVFLRADIRLLDLVNGTHLYLTAGLAVLLGGILIGQVVSGFRPTDDTGRWAFWGVFTAILLGLVEYSVEWQRATLLSPGQTVVLSAANVENVTQHYVTARDGLFRTDVLVNGVKAEALIDTGASLVLLNHATALAAGVDVGKLNFDQPVATVSGPMKIARVTIDAMSVGAIRLTDVEAAVTPPGREHSNLLGASFLSKLDAATFRGDSAVLQQRN